MPSPVKACDLQRSEFKVYTKSKAGHISSPHFFYNQDRQISIYQGTEAMHTDMEALVKDMNSDLNHCAPE